MSSKARALCAALLLITTQGCFSLVDLTTSHNVLGSPESRGPHIYGGTRINMAMFGEEACKVPAWCLTLVTILDFPLSFVLDTLLLPISIPTELLRPDPESNPELSE